MNHRRGMAQPAPAIARLAVAAAIAAVAASGLAAEADPVPARQVVDAALKHDLRLQTDAREIEAAQARLDQAAAQGRPSLTLDARAGHYAGLEDVTLTPQFVIPSVPDQYGAALTLSQPLYTGGQVSRRKRSAAFAEQAAMRTREAGTADVVLQALTAYWNWSKADSSIATLRSAVARVAAHAADVRNQHEAGLATDNDALATDVLLERTRLRLETATRGVELARAHIAFLTGLDFSSNATPEEATAPAETPIPEEGGLVDSAMTNRPERAAALLAVRSSQMLVGASRADYLPRVSLIARYDDAQPNALFFPPREEWNDDLYAGIAASWNVLDSGLTRARVREAIARREQAWLHLQQVEEQLRLEVREARLVLQDAVSRLAVAVRVEQSAQRNVSVAEDLWHNGLARHSDALDAQAQLTDAQFERVSARADLMLARAALERAVGAPAVP